jgi:hypothetical protein
MGRKTLGLCAPLIVTVLAACASSPPGSDSAAPPARGGSDLITRAEMDRGQWVDAYELVRNLRPRWIEARGVDTVIGRAGEVQVYVDGMRLGSVDLLRNVPTSAIDRLEWVDPISAAGRWGLGHNHGVIAVSYRPANDP